MAPEDEKRPSPILTYLLGRLEEVLPAADRPRLAPYQQAARSITPHGDLHRAWRCAAWAVELAQTPAHSHLSRAVQTLEEGYRLGKDTWYGAEFGLSVVAGVHPGLDIETQWVDGALAAAQAAAGRSGWDSVPWEQLVKDLLAVG